MKRDWNPLRFGTFIAVSLAITMIVKPLCAAADVAFDQRLDGAVPQDVVLHDQDGATVRLGDYFGDKPVVLMPVYYRCPMLCGLELNGLVRCLRGMDITAGSDFQILTFSIDPREQPELALRKQKQYLAEYGREAGAGWQFLTGDEPEIARLTEAIGFKAEYDAETGQYAHAAGIVVCTPEGRIARYLFGVEFAPRDLQLALVEASQNKIGSFTDQMWLYCYMYDATTGKYGLAIMRIVRACGMFTVAVILTGVALMLRRERKQHRERADELVDRAGMQSP